MMEHLIVKKSKGLQGEVRVPGDKSISHRAVIFGSIAEGETEIHGLLRGEDSLNTLRAFMKMGVEIDDQGATVRIAGTGLGGLQEPKDVLDLGNSGTGMRLLAGLLAGRDFFSVLTGDVYLCRRPMGRITRPLRNMGASILGRDDARLAPLAIQGGGLQGMEYLSPVSSAQVKSSILLAGLSASGRTTVIEPVLSRDHTERMLRRFGYEVEQEGNRVSLTGGGRLCGCSIKVPSDFSSAAFFIVAALIVKGSGLLIRDVGINPTRAGLLPILERMGAEVHVEETVAGEEPVADIRVCSTILEGTNVEPEEVPGAIDEFPILCVAAAFAEGETRITGAAELRVKETDRIHAMVENLRSIGAEVEELEDGMIIRGQKSLRGGVCNSFGDHRVAMSMAVAGLRCREGVKIEDTQCIGTSFPGFREILKGVRGERG
jgi:3-phosphoshikimate 1-carboxyvinyltransferase